MLAILCTLLVLLAIHYRVVDVLADRASSNSSGTLDGGVALLLLVPLATTIYARRRYREAVAVRRELVHLSLHDALTGLPNRRLLIDWLATDIAQAQQLSAQTGVLFVDLDRFKFVNDTHGHEVGDRLMRAVADRLRHMLEPGDRLVRFGGDEFVIVCPTLQSAAAAEKVARRAIGLIEAPFTIGDESIRISASVGVALAEHRGVKPEDVLRDADVAMFQAKAQGPGHVVTFDRSLSGSLTPATAEEQIRSALEAGDFHLHYQPVVDLTNGQIVGAEALLRWMSPSRGTMSPAEFIPILEETGLIVPVGTWVLEEACRQAVRLRQQFPDRPPLKVTVNVSARQIAQVGFGEVVAHALQSTGVSHGQIHLEITEGALMHDVSSAWAVLRQAKALGVKLALDDFGTGYSSLSYIRRFSLDMLKIDKSFIDGIDSSPEDRAIVEHVVGMADALGMATVAEGVERPEQLAWLRRLGCRLAQGYTLSRPLPANELEDLIRRRIQEPFEIGPVPARGHDLEIPDHLRSEPPPAPPRAGPGASALFDAYPDLHADAHPPPPEPRPATQLSIAPDADRLAEVANVDISTLTRTKRGPALPRLREYRAPEGTDRPA